MRFVCDSCRAQYMISDDKVGAKGVKVRCKKCGYVILVRRPDAADGEGPTHVGPHPLGGAQGMDESTTSPGADAAASDEPMTQANASPFGASSGDASQRGEGMLGDLEDDEIGAVFDQVLRSGPQKIPADANGSISNGSMALTGGEDDLASTRVVSLDALQKLALEAEAKERTGDANGNGHADERAKSNVPTTDWFVAVDDAQVGPLTLEELKEKWDRGEVGAESLCWRAGFSDWTALSEVAALASVLAPRPTTKPVIVSPASVSGSLPGGMVSVPVESAFSAGGMSQTVRSEVTMMAGELTPLESGGWKPSAASALASLAMQEMEEVQSHAKKPAPKAAPQEKGLLDLPAENLISGRASVPSPGTDTDPRHRAMGEGFSSASAPFPQPSYDTYRPPTQPPPPDKSSRNLLAIGAVIVLLVLVLGGAVVYLFVQQKAGPSTGPIVASNVPPPVNPANATAPAPATPANPTTVAAASPTPAPGTAAATPAPGTPAPPGKAVASATPAPGPKASELPPPPPIKSDVSEERVPRHRATHRNGSAEREPKETVASNEGGENFAQPAPPRNKKDDDEFADVFGKRGDGDATPATKKKSTQYIPPPPGQGAGGDMPDKLSMGDIMSVVVQNKPAIVGCVSEQKKKDPGVTGTLVMRWNITPAGRTTGVAVRTDEFKSSYMASCVTGLIKTWSFPKHKVQGDPIDFPFKF